MAQTLSGTPSMKRQIQSSILVKQHSLGISVTLQMPANGVNKKVDTVDSARKGDKLFASTVVWFLFSNPYCYGVPFYFGTTV
jgi:hypothetical protein